MRTLRIVKLLGAAPALAACTACNKQFKASMKSLRSVADARDEIQRAFDAHKCEAMDSSQNAVRESTEEK